MNPLLNTLRPQNNSFFSFMQQFKGQNPSQIIQSMISSGKITQDQLQQVQEKAKQMESQFESMKSAFGFK